MGINGETGVRPLITSSKHGYNLLSWLNIQVPLFGGSKAERGIPVSKGSLRDQVHSF